MCKAAQDNYNDWTQDEIDLQYNTKDRSGFHQESDHYDIDRMPKSRRAMHAVQTPIVTPGAYPQTVAPQRVPAPITAAVPAPIHTAFAPMNQAFTDATLGGWQDVQRPMTADTSVLNALRSAPLQGSVDILSRHSGRHTNNVRHNRAIRQGLMAAPVAEVTTQSSATRTQSAPSAALAPQAVVPDHATIVDPPIEAVDPPNAPAESINYQDEHNNWMNSDAVLQQPVDSRATAEHWGPAPAEPEVFYQAAAAPQQPQSSQTDHRKNDSYVHPQFRAQFKQRNVNQHVNHNNADQPFIHS